MLENQTPIKFQCEMPAGMSVGEFVFVGQRMWLDREQTFIHCEQLLQDLVK